MSVAKWLAEISSCQKEARVIVRRLAVDGDRFPSQTAIELMVTCAGRSLLNEIQIRLRDPRLSQAIGLITQQLQ